VIVIADRHPQIDRSLADDSVLVWVLPSVQSVTVEPNLTVVPVSDPPSPGPTVRTFVEMELIHQAIVPVKGKAGTAAEMSCHRLRV